MDKGRKVTEVTGNRLRYINRNISRTNLPAIVSWNNINRESSRWQHQGFIGGVIRENMTIFVVSVISVRGSRVPLLTEGTIKFSIRPQEIEGPESNRSRRWDNPRTKGIFLKENTIGLCAEG